MALAVPAPAVVVPEALAPRAACPVTSRYASYSTSRVYRGTVTLTNGVVYNGPATSTKTESELRVITTQETVYSPSVTTYPGEFDPPLRPIRKLTRLLLHRNHLNYLFPRRSYLDPHLPGHHTIHHSPRLRTIVPVPGDDSHKHHPGDVEDHEHI